MEFITGNGEVCECRLLRELFAVRSLSQLQQQQQQQQQLKPNCNLSGSHLAPTLFDTTAIQHLHKHKSLSI